MSTTLTQPLTTALEGVTLHVADVEKSLDFYTRIPGANVEIHEPGNFALLRIGAARLGLLGHWQEQRFHVEIVTDDLNAMHTALVTAGIKPESEPKKEEWGEVDFFVKDPDGYMLEFGHSHPAG